MSSFFYGYYKKLQSLLTTILYDTKYRRLSTVIHQEYKSQVQPEETEEDVDYRFKGFSFPQFRGVAPKLDKEPDKPKDA